jgi:DNA-binding NarL/FixJ family response regulator
MWAALVVEDNKNFRHNFIKFMSSRFPTVEFREAASGEKALEEISRRPPDIVFMDIELPGENGIEVTKKIRERYPNIFIVVLTSYKFPEYRDAAYQSGADRFLVKGTTKLEEIAATVASVISD